MKAIRLPILLGLVLVLAVAASASAVLADQCLSCHSDPARLIPAMREIIRAAGRVPSGSAMGAGEG